MRHQNGSFGRRQLGSWLHPAQLRERLGVQGYAALNKEERKAWWLALPEFPDVPPEEWTT